MDWLWCLLGSGGVAAVMILLLFVVLFSGEYARPW